MAWGPDGRLYVTQESGSLAVVARDSRRPLVVARSLRTPLGLAWKGKLLFVSQQGRLERFVLVGGKLRLRRALVRDLPFGRHQQDNVVVGRDGRLYLGSGSTCDACRERDPRSATILSLRPDGTDLRVVARGLRNPFGLAVHPRSGRLYASVNEQDELGTVARPEPAETVVIVRRGAFYGWPRCWPSYRRKRMVGRCRGVTPPAAYLEPHSSADGIAFYTGTTFPPAYRRDLFVALWGQYNSPRHGRRVVRIDLRPDGKARRVIEFADGFDHPLALLVDPGGGLLVADWGRGMIYRIQARGQT
jgi:glucose/arabinose dehydrogenase